jgi:hypothetical protein
MDQNVMGPIVIIAIITVILYVAFNNPLFIIYVIISMLSVIIVINCLQKSEQVSLITPSPITQSPITPSSSLCKEDEVKVIEKDNSDTKNYNKNLYELDKMYGLRNCENADDKITKFKKRIGDREHKAAIIQSRGRRNNSIEPYYREELSAWGASRWWEPDTVLMRKATPEQMATIQMGPMRL